MIKFNKYIVGVFAVTLTSVVLLSGCNKGINSAEKLITAMQEKVSELTSFSLEVDLELNMDYSVDETNDNMVLNYDEYLDTVLDTKEVYAEGSMSVTDVYNEAWESYIVSENDAYVSYSCVNGEWYYNDISSETIDKGPADLMDIILGIEGYAFSKAENYTITAKAVSEDILDILNCLYANVMDSAFSEGVDTSNMGGTVTVEVDKETILPESLTIVFDDCSDMFVGEGMFDSASIKKFVLEVDFSKYNMTEDISVPSVVTDLFKLPEGEDIYDNPQQEPTKGEDEPEAPTLDYEDTNVIIDEQGYYELTDYDAKASVKIKAPEGYVFSSESDSAMISFDREGAADDNFCTLVYEMARVSDNFSKEDIEGNMKIYYDFYGTDESYEQMEYIDKHTTTVDDFTVGYSGIKYYTAGDEFYKGGYYTWYQYWVYVEDYVVICNITDFSADGFVDFDAEAVAQMLFAGADMD